MTNAQAYKERSPQLIRERDRANKMKKRRAEGMRSREAYNEARRAAAKEKQVQERWTELTPEEVVIHLYERWKVEDVERWYERVESRGAILTKYDRRTITNLKSMDEVPNEIVRLGFEHLSAKGFGDEVTESISQELRQMERRAKKSANTYGSVRYSNKHALKCALGIDQCGGGKEGKRLKIFCDYRLAEACCKAMGIVPREAGI